MTYSSGKAQRARRHQAAALAVGSHLPTAKPKARSAQSLVTTVNTTSTSTDTQLLQATVAQPGAFALSFAIGKCTTGATISLSGGGLEDFLKK